MDVQTYLKRVKERLSRFVLLPEPGKRKPLHYLRMKSFRKNL